MEFYNPEDGGDVFSETSSLTTATRCNNLEDIHHWCRSENMAEDSLIQPYIEVSSLATECITPGSVLYITSGIPYVYIT
jgi:hypothetical protein